MANAETDQRECACVVRARNAVGMSESPAEYPSIHPSSIPLLIHHEIGFPLILLLVTNQDSREQRSFVISCRVAVDRCCC
jgi:hypothetical protein